MALRYLFIDMNSYFASVEQQDRPDLRGRPVAVVPVKADTTCCITTSHEARKFGVKTGTMVSLARKLCPGIRLVLARTERYVEVHHQIVEAVASCLPVDGVKSIDEMICRLHGQEREPARAGAIARQVKHAIWAKVGRSLNCSIGVAPNRLLAKVAADMQKPDGLTVLRREGLPERLHALELKDFPGVGPRMERRLHKSGITTVKQLCQLDVRQLGRIWGSKLMGRAWWHKLRGEDVAERPTQRHSFSHSRVLPPALR